MGRHVNQHQRHIPNKEKDEGMLSHPFVRQNVTNVWIFVRYLNHDDPAHLLHLLSQPDGVQLQAVVGGDNPDNFLGPGEFATG
jgi:hypothetical protein